MTACTNKIAVIGERGACRDARRRAEERVAAFVDRLEQSGVHAEGPFDPLAIADALPPFQADDAEWSCRFQQATPTARE